MTGCRDKISNINKYTIQNILHEIEWSIFLFIIMIHRCLLYINITDLQHFDGFGDNNKTQNIIDFRRIIRNN